MVQHIAKLSSRQIVSLTKINATAAIEMPRSNHENVASKSG